MRKIAILLLLSMFIFVVGCRKETQEIKKLEDVVYSEKNGIYSCTFDGFERSFTVYLPENCSDKIPVIFMLHGYGSTAEAFQLDTQMNKTACPQGYAVVYISGISNPKDKTSAPGWNSGIGDSDVDDVGFISAVADYTHENLNCDAEKSFVVGFSNGAFMIHRLAVEAPEKFSGFVSVAGMMPEKIWKNRGKINSLNFLQINGSDDDVVPMKLNGSDKNSKAPAIESVIDYYAEECGLDKCEKTALSEKAVLTKYNADGKNSSVWSVLVNGGRHSWFKESTAGFDTNELILEFFQQKKS